MFNLLVESSEPLDNNCSSLLHNNAAFTYEPILEVMSNMNYGTKRINRMIITSSVTPTPSLII